MKAAKIRVERIDDVRVRVPIQGAMRVEGRIYADEALMAHLTGDASVAQVANVACLPGIVGAALAMPDIHSGYGFPIGGVAAFDPDNGGVVSPGGVGYDINCGVRLHALDLDAEEVNVSRDRLGNDLLRAVPAGVGVGRSDSRLPQLDLILQEGVGALVNAGIVSKADLETIEDGGCIRGADPAAVSAKARDRGFPQIGSLGSGNHFLEVDRVAAIYDAELAEAFGLSFGKAVLLIHSGSRGLGHQVCEDVLPVMVRAARNAGIELPDKQLACAPLGSEEANRYLRGMAAAANFAFANRAMLAERALTAIAAWLGVAREKLEAPLIYDVCHNIAKMEEHMIGGRSMRVCVHRKGATRAFGPNNPALPERYRLTGQPVIVPGDMGRYSYVLAGAKGAMEETFGSSCHGAGRLMSRGEAKRKMTGKEVVRVLAQRGIAVKAASVDAAAEEMPDAYKDVADVVSVVDRAGIAKKVARLEPMLVVKG
ncbi:MAG: RtcB family protein [Polyangiaceae bacterium]|nr:RtcB family protein [Polyangiaceae bacterium]